MKLVFLDDVPGVAHGGDVKNVKNGFARNYLIPQNLAVPATRDALERIERLKEQATNKRLKTLTDMKDLAAQMAGTRVEIGMRAGASGRLYGSVTNTVIAEKLETLTSREIDRRVIQIPESIRETGLYQVSIRVHPEVVTDVSLLVHPINLTPDEYLAELESKESENDPETLDDDADTISDVEESTEEAIPEISDNVEKKTD